MKIIRTVRRKYRKRDIALPIDVLYIYTLPRYIYTPNQLELDVQKPQTSSAFRCAMEKNKTTKTG